MHRILQLVAVAVLAITSTASVAEDVTYTVAKAVPFGENSMATREVKASCTLDTRLPQFIAAAAKRGVKVVLTDEPLENVKGRVLYLEIVHVLGTGGGAWSGAKSVTVEGRLVEDGNVIGTFTAARYSGGGAFGGFKGTCAILGRCIQAIGKDIAGWLKNPTMNAMLGNA